MRAAADGWTRHIVFCLIFLTLLLLSVVVYSEAAQQAIDQYHTDCVMCHRTSTPAYDEASAVAPDLDMSSVCMDCHHYSETHHPVNFTPDRDIDSRFPLLDGEMQCLTCHEAHGTNRLSNPGLLRGAPYADRREICSRCHTLDLDLSFNPHVMTEPDGTIRVVNNGPICLVCHAAVPDQRATRIQVIFRADVAFICWRCHPPMPASFFNAHFQIKPRRQTLAFMKQHAKEQGVLLPLLNRGRITCSTCHNPHQAGIIVKSAAAVGADSYKKLRLTKGRICTGCHQNK
ncbi:MAG: cytochrome c3 family protein [Nitrospirae bacterium]|nr:cytochrome c3 family protein [Nitrospirota bacterium]